MVCSAESTREGIAPPHPSLTETKTVSHKPVKSLRYPMEVEIFGKRWMLEQAKVWVERPADGGKPRWLPRLRVTRVEQPRAARRQREG